MKINRYDLSEILMRVYDHGDRPNALKEADVIIDMLEAYSKLPERR